MTCSKCGAQIPQGTDRCPNCYSPVPRPSFVQRLLSGFGFRAPARRTVVKTRTTEIRTERVEVQDPQTGQVRVYGSLDEVPADIRAKIEQARSTAPQSGAHTKITVKDAAGNTRTYDSVDEMPAEIRQIYERIRRERTK
jgi:hypothetical protein